MSEQDWLTAATPLPILMHFVHRARTSCRKLQLFASACRLRIPARAAIRWEQLRRATHQPPRGRRRQRVVVPGIPRELVNAAHAAEQAVVMTTSGFRRRTRQQAAVFAERATQSALARDIFGNPFRPVTFEPVWRTATVSSLADTIYHARAFDALPILADALEDAGCDNREILDHCRQPGLHVRGCWLVDLVLGKQ